MKKLFRSKMFLTVVIITFTILSGCGDDITHIHNTPDASTDPSTDAMAAASFTYVYGYSPVTVMQKAHDQTNSTFETVYAPINALYIDTETSTPDSQLWVSPNVNVLYSSSHMDLTAEPMVLYTPSIQDRYFSWEIMDAYTNAFDYVGSRKTGGVEGTYAFVGPDWSGSLPEGYTRIDCPTNSVWMVGRHEVMPGDDDDREAVIALVQQSVLLPLDDFINKDSEYVNPIIEHPEETVPGLDINGLKFLTLLNEWLTKNPPPASEVVAAEIMASIGVCPGCTTDFQSLPQIAQYELLAGLEAGLAVIVGKMYTSGVDLNGWKYVLGADFGNYGTSYLLRAVTTRSGLGANVNEEAIYPVRLFGPQKLPLTGDRSYRLTFTDAQLPVPVNEHGFWSLTMYDRLSGILVENSMDRYSLGSQNDLHVAPDGSITIYIQRDNPEPDGGMEKNWLPSPENSDPFYMLFRAYYPDEEMITPVDEPTWILPNLTRPGTP
ncbi:MAG: DUF1254 domain-containing protein [Proteobacteria bacterium]|nr:DUF1254 domain-containing protein [Pseudomonadota bacterium]